MILHRDSGLRRYVKDSDSDSNGRGSDSDVWESDLYWVDLTTTPQIAKQTFFLGLMPSLELVSHLNHS